MEREIAAFRLIGQTDDGSVISIAVHEVFSRVRELVTGGRSAIEPEPGVRIDQRRFPHRQ